MLLRNRIPGIDAAPVTASPEYEHVAASSIAVVRWLNACVIDYVLVGALARAIRGDRDAEGPVAIVPAPYGRNLERLSRALEAVQARSRATVAPVGGITAQPADAAPLKLTAEQLVGSLRWTLQCGAHELDVEGRPVGVPSFQELLFESFRFELAPELKVEVASPQDIELYAHIGRTGRAPEISVTRADQAGVVST